MHSELFRPLGMASSGLISDLDSVNASRHYSITNGSTRQIEPGPVFSTRLMGPWGAIRCSIEDLLAFGRAHVDESMAYANPNILEALREVHSSTAIPAWLDGWCLGWAYYNWKGGPVWGWEGLESFGTGHRAMLRILPQQRGVIALLANTNSGRSLYRSLFPLLLDRYFGVEMPGIELSRPKAPAEQLSYYAGTFGLSQFRAIVENQGDRLMIMMPGEQIDVIRVGEGWFLKNPDDPDYAQAFTFKDFSPEGHPQVVYYFLEALPRLEIDTE
jgi:CubicO group peptidase (beta-lactamase class C family)